jgi:glycosyltransferase involved in cell wall biosynthesis
VASTGDAHKRLSVTFVVSYMTPGGGGRVVASYASALRRRGHDVTVLVRKPAAPGILGRLKAAAGRREKTHEDAWPPAYLDAARVPYIPYTSDDGPAPGEIPDADAIVATFWPTAPFVARLPAGKGAKFYFVQGDEPNFFDPASKWYEALRARALATYSLPFRFITISEFLVRRLRAYGVAPAAVIPNAVDGALFDAPPRGRGTPATIGLLYSNSWIKGTDVAFAALEQVRARFPELRAELLSIVPRSREYPVPDYAAFHHLPPEAEIRELYSRCDAWLCASRLEGFHLPPLEAMACRTPAVSTRVGGPEEYIEHGRTGYLGDIDDAEALAARLIDVLSMDGAAWRAMSEAAYARAHAYAWDDAAARLEAALADGVAAERAGR